MKGRGEERERGGKRRKERRKAEKREFPACGA
jgi:hypothetical protein